jgi:hypothetical protein
LLQKWLSNFLVSAPFIILKSEDLKEVSSPAPHPATFGGTAVLIQGFVLAKQALYLLNHTSSPFCPGYFGDEISGTICPGDLKTQSSQSQPPK